MLRRVRSGCILAQQHQHQRCGSPRDSTTPFHSAPCAALQGIGPAAAAADPLVVAERVLPVVVGLLRDLYADVRLAALQQVPVLGEWLCWRCLHKAGGAWGGCKECMA